MNPSVPPSGPLREVDRSSTSSPPFGSVSTSDTPLLLSPPSRSAPALGFVTYANCAASTPASNLVSRTTDPWCVVDRSPSAISVSSLDVQSVRPMSESDSRPRLPRTFGDNRWDPVRSTDPTWCPLGSRNSRSDRWGSVVLDSSPTKTWPVTGSNAMPSRSAFRRGIPDSPIKRTGSCTVAVWMCPVRGSTLIVSG